MKRVGFIYETIYEESNIRRAIQSAAKKKRKKRVVRKVLQREAYFVRQIQEMLKNKDFCPSPYIESKFYDALNKKERIIHKPKFYPDQIIHWCLMNKIDHLLARGIYQWTCASIPKRGTHYAKNVVQKWLRTSKNRTKYYVKLDIRKYYHSIDKELLKSKFRKLIKCEATLSLIDTIIDSHNKGLPIGNYTSQWFANFYLQEIDHYIKQELQVPYYIRYMDDLVLFSGNKRKLKKAFSSLKTKIREHGLEIKGNPQIHEISKRSLSFVGFVFNHKRTFIRKRITRNCRRRVLRYRVRKNTSGAHAITSYYGWYKHSDSYILEQKYFNKENILLKAKEQISYESRKIFSNYPRRYA